MNSMSLEDMITLAKEKAWVYHLNYDYIPKTREALADWKVHDWVISAIISAYFQGRDDARNSN